MTTFETILLSITSFFCAGLIYLIFNFLDRFAKKIDDFGAKFDGLKTEISELNGTLLVTVERQGWQYKAIESLDDRVKRLESK